jgi:hypothetical protein
MRVEHDAERLPLDADEPHGQSRVVGQRRPDADHDRLVGRAHHLDTKVGDRTRDAQTRIVRGPGGETVRRLRKLQRDARPSHRHA